MIVISGKTVIKRGILFLGIFCIGVLGYYVQEKKKLITVNSSVSSYCIVIDAGHGKPDGGATSKNGVEEETLNLLIAQKLKEKLENLGYEIVMTRKTHENIATIDANQSLRNIKQSDLQNRVNIANQSMADFMISIHMNEFANSKYWGWQTFYSKNSQEGKILASLIQKGISQRIERPNHRTSLPIEGIKIVDKTNLPVVIVECGFLSNEEEVKLLQTDEYQNQLVEGIVSGIEDYYEGLN